MRAVIGVTGKTQGFNELANPYEILKMSMNIKKALL
jgi:hypothetical protein